MHKFLELRRHSFLCVGYVCITLLVRRKGCSVRVRGYTREVNIKGRKALGDRRGGAAIFLLACSTLKLKKVIYLVIRLSWLPSDVEYNI